MLEGNVLNQEGANDYINDHTVDPEPSLQEAFGNLPGIYSKLMQLGITTLSDILGLNDQELDELSGRDMLALVGPLKLKFKSNVRVLRNKYGLPRNGPLVTISKTERAALQSLDVAIKQADGLDNVFKYYLRQIEQREMKMRTSVDEKTEFIIRALQMWNEKKHAHVIFSLNAMNMSIYDGSSSV